MEGQPLRPINIRLLSPSNTVHQTSSEPSPRSDRPNSPSSVGSASTTPAPSIIDQQFLSDARLGMSSSPSEPPWPRTAPLKEIQFDFIRDQIQGQKNHNIYHYGSDNVCPIDWEVINYYFTQRFWRFISKDTLCLAYERSFEEWDRACSAEEPKNRMKVLKRRLDFENEVERRTRLAEEVYGGAEAIARRAKAGGKSEIGMDRSGKGLGGERVVLRGGASQVDKPRRKVITRETVEADADAREAAALALSWG